MKPLNYRNQSPCENTSSKCVVWDGPDIPCLNLCTGDTIEDVVYKGLKELCNILSALDVSTYDLKCLEGCNIIDIKSLLQAIVNKICSLNISEEVNNAIDDYIVTLPECLRYRDGSGNLVTQLPLPSYLLLIGTKICQINASITTINGDIQNLNNQITNLTNIITECCNNSPLSLSINTCLWNGGKNVPDSISFIAQKLCDLRNSVCGNDTDCLPNTPCILPNTPTLSNPSNNYSSLGYSTVPNSIVGHIDALWIVVCDIRQAIMSTLSTCCNGVNTQFSISHTVIPAGSGSYTVNFSITGPFSSWIVQGGSVPYVLCGNNGTIPVTYNSSTNTYSGTTTVTVPSTCTNPVISGTVVLQENGGFRTCGIPFNIPIGSACNIDCNKITVSVINDNSNTVSISYKNESGCDFGDSTDPGVVWTIVDEQHSSTIVASSSFNVSNGATYTVSPPNNLQAGTYIICFYVVNSNNTACVKCAKFTIPASQTLCIGSCYYEYNYLSVD